MSSAPAETWWHEAQRDAMLLDVLAALKVNGPLDNEQLARACVPLDELVGSIPGQERRRRAASMIEAAIAYLEEDGDLTNLEAPTRLWRQSVERARVLLRWREIPPVVGRLAILYADTLIRYAFRHGWVTRFDIPSGPLWRITDAGLIQLEELEARLDVSHPA
ncbi:hypothetical protein [Mucisphaera calidilacus]|uniref:Uncharacterized protein n=1 Tax=Mucisphaera calidilacus TaxID=2527982 RepID=A0A518BXB1_9BACT|nr:hypothetical protein [Mucisphaera calidilacus]QDU71619.1 hypothetical protein Pan265_14710 [Mucisphaera calidilacus]